MIPPAAYYAYHMNDDPVTPPRRKRRGSGFVEYTPPRTRADMSGIPFQRPGSAYNRKRFRDNQVARKRARQYGPYRPMGIKIHKAPRIRHSGSIGNNQASCTVALHQLQTLDLSATADMFFCVQPADILQCPGLARYRYMYDRPPQLPVELVGNILEMDESYCDLSFDRPEGFSSHKDVMNFLYERAKYNLFRA